MPLKVCKVPRSPYWYVRGTIGGVEIFQSTKKRAKAEAEAYRLALEVQLEEEERRFSSGQKTFSEAAEAYKRNGGEERFLDAIEKKIGTLYLDEINQGVCDRVSREMFPTQKLSYIRRAFYDPTLAVINYAAKIEWCHRPAIDRPKPARVAPKWAEPWWFEAFWPHCSDQLRAVTTFLAYTGCRVTEAVDLVWERVSLDEGWAYIPETKNSEPRTVHLPKIVIDRLRVIKKDGGKVFPWSSKDGVNTAIRRAVARTNKAREKDKLEPIQYLSSHKLGSHTYATWMRRYGKLDQRGLVGTGRWKDIKSTMIYTHTVATEDARKSDLLPVPGEERTENGVHGKSTEPSANS